MKTKLSIVKEHLAKGDLAAALRVAAKFPQLGEHKRAIVLGHEAFTNPGFYRQLGKDPEALKESARLALVARFSE